MAETARLACPGCSQPTTAHALEGKYGQPLALDLCFPCNVVWFDGFESLLLAPGAILALFTLIHEHRGEQQHRPLARPACPRCRVALVETHDRQRHVAFRYWRCPAEHGRLTTFVEFLREKDFVRPLAPAELADSAITRLSQAFDDSHMIRGTGAGKHTFTGPERRVLLAPLRDRQVRPWRHHAKVAELLAEYDNTQRGANHVHTVWRDPRADFGRDVLAAHYATTAPSHGHHH